MSRLAYQYSIIRYSHDAVSGECLNVGLVLFVPKERRVEVRWPSSFMRVQLAYPGSKAAGLSQALPGLASALQANLVKKSQLTSLDELLRETVPEDLAGLRMSNLGVGFAASVEGALEDLMQRFVLRWEAWRADVISLDFEHGWPRYSPQNPPVLIPSNDATFDAWQDSESLTACR